MNEDWKLVPGTFMNLILTPDLSVTDALPLRDKYFDSQQCLFQRPLMSEKRCDCKNSI